MQLRASFYAEYARRLASWGYAVLQYDTGLLRIIDDRTEVCAAGAIPVLTCCDVAARMRAASYALLCQTITCHTAERALRTWLCQFDPEATAEPHATLCAPLVTSPSSKVRCWHRTFPPQTPRAAATTQLQYMDSVLEWLAGENARPGGFAQDLLHLTTIGVAGHSRGAKLAVLHLVGESPRSVIQHRCYTTNCGHPGWRVLHQISIRLRVGERLKHEIHALCSVKVSHAHQRVRLCITDRLQRLYCCSRSAGDARVKAAYLLDPVDNTQQTPEGPKYPSAVRALRDAGLPVGIAGAGLTGSCNPADANHQVRDCYGVECAVQKQPSHN